jgi:catechol 2,3-dioxygenase-like lactoylglutathione lyase family enzyme
MTDNPGVFDHVGIRVSDRGASRRFYQTVLAPLGRTTTNEDPDFDEWNDFAIGPESAERSLTERLHVAVVAGSQAEVDTFLVGRRRGRLPQPRRSSARAR